MNKLIIIGLCIALLVLSGCELIKHPELKRLEHYCEAHKIPDECTYGVADCHAHCNQISMKYLKYDDTGFGSNECWCIKNINESVQIY